MPARRAAAMMALPSSTDEAIGFSTITCTPRSIAAIASSMWQVGGGRNGQRIDPGCQQSLDFSEAGTAERVGYEIALFAIGIDNAGELDPGQIGQHAGVVASHNTDAGNPDA